MDRFRTTTHTPEKDAALIDDLVGHYGMAGVLRMLARSCNRWGDTYSSRDPERASRWYKKADALVGLEDTIDG